MNQQIINSGSKNNRLTRLRRHFSAVMRRNSCSICLEKMDWLQKIKTLKCGHKFHLTCINMIYKAQCPLCSRPIFHKFEEKLLNCKNISKITNLLQTHFSENENTIQNIYFFIKHRLTLDISKTDAANYLQILKLAHKYCDFTDILANNLNDQSVVEELIESAQINWYKTFDGKTFFELVIEKTENLVIVNLILDKLPKASIRAMQAHEIHDPVGGAQLYPVIRPSAPCE